MAIIYSYPTITNLTTTDLFIISRLPEDPEGISNYSVTLNSISTYIISAAFNGRNAYIPVFDGDSSIIDSALKQDSSDSPTSMTVNSGVNFGVGTLDLPQAPFHVRKSGGGEAIRVENGNIGFYNIDNKHSYIGKETNTNPSLVLESIGSTNKIVLKTGGSERMRITGDGRVGINSSVIGSGQILKVGGTHRSVVVSKGGNLGVGVDQPSAYIHSGGSILADGSITGTRFKLSSLNTPPATATSSGNTGDIKFTTDYIYVCVATNTWKRAAISTWT